MNKRLYSPAVIREIQKKWGFQFQKSLGQNFLIDGNIVRAIVDAADIGEGDAVLEIGAGIGTLTEELALRGAEVFCVEIDEHLKPILDETLGQYPSVEIFYKDVLKTDLKSELESRFPDKKIKVVANLPYYVTTPIITHILDADIDLDSIYIMVQKEMATRMAASPGSKLYGSISVYLQMRGEVSISLHVPRTCFMPQPNVDSAVLAIRDVKDEYPETLRQAEAIVRAAFSKRRKTVLNALSTYGFAVEKEDIAGALEDAGIDPSRRAETISVEEYRILAKNFPKVTKEYSGDEG
ncbi:MAG: 16S rRNA (adenine(1518)-N(6)/adenine(1519)-N(6))-dimethyltransferase RsmA [Peptoniphilus sp.]|nr:16S rRNA (adenine(1518)-N(6)/adenine(1519)-N(6))-dimethyltransferase RsmA [Peptoniphilus sp.]MDY6045002.1 16S rRNA (adenine(1518)-N(6)/adenine(1519)-N(6))-dimethyltransferase RsmA [Peptoniphilus sp.]